MSATLEPDTDVRGKVLRSGSLEETYAYRRAGTAGGGQRPLGALLRGAGGQRHYSEQDVERVLFIQRLYAAGLSSHTIAEVMPCVESPGTDTSEAALHRMREERDRISHHIDELLQTRDNLEALIAANIAHRATLTSPQSTSAASTRARSAATS
jgi:DNA-binding transcriptional MerR regulator